MNRAPRGVRSAEYIRARAVVVESGCWEWPVVVPLGYGRVGYMGRTERAHRYSFIAHGGTFENGPFVLHSCDNRRCVNPAHLRSGTIADNSRDAIERGRHCHGERHGSAKLTEAKVREIIKRVRSGETQRSLAREFGVRRDSIGHIMRGITWSHVDRYAAAIGGSDA